MSDVTFGVKVTEELKNELSELMKSNDLTGKEFMQLLINTYKIDQKKQEEPFFASDISELQILLQRIQSIYINVTEKSKTLLLEKEALFEKERLSNHELGLVLKEDLDKAKASIEELKQTLQQKQDLIHKLKEDNQQLESINQETQAQAKNYLLLTKKFEQEVERLHIEINHFQKLETENAEFSQQNNILKNKNDELASEIWFLKRETEKLEAQKDQLVSTYQLELKNKLLEQEIAFNKKMEILKEEKLYLQQEFNKKLQDLYEATQNLDEKS